MMLTGAALIEVVLRGIRAVLPIDDLTVADLDGFVARYRPALVATAEAALAARAQRSPAGAAARTTTSVRQAGVWAAQAVGKDVEHVAARLERMSVGEEISLTNAGRTMRVRRTGEGFELTGGVVPVDPVVDVLPRPFPAGDPEVWSTGDRTRVNLAAMHILADGRPIGGEERRVLEGYTGWGGLSIDKVRGKFPTAFPAPESRGLVHEYYTPMSVWRAVAAHLAPVLRDGDSAMEPSAGIGRALRAMPQLRWTAVEASAVSAALVAKLFPTATIHHGFFEEFAPRLSGSQDFVLANPPYGPRGEAMELDADSRFGTKRAYLYFIGRGIDALKPGGWAVFIVPTGWLTGTSAEMRKARERILREGHLAEAFRLPSQPEEGGSRLDIAYDNFVVDVLVFQRRPQALADVPDADRFIVDGGYYREFPTHVLGRPIGTDEGWEPGQPKARRGYQLVGRFRGLPAWSPRPMADGTAAAPATVRAAADRGGIGRRDVVVDVAGLPERLQEAMALGARLDTYLARVAAQDAQATASWRELHDDLQAWRKRHGDPLGDEELRILAAGRSVPAQRFLAVWSRAGLTPAMSRPPDIKQRLEGNLNLDQIAEWVFAQGGSQPISAASVAAAWREHSGQLLTPAVAQGRLLQLGWCLDGPDMAGLVPGSTYYTGLLWPKYDRAVAAKGPQAAAQATQLKQLIGWRSGPAIVSECLPVDSWLPVGMVEAWIASTIKGGGYRLEWEDGLLKPKATTYALLDNTDKRRTPPYSRDFLSFIGWANVDNGLWNPEREKKADPETGEEKLEPIGDARAKQAAEWTESWRKWLNDSDERLSSIEDHYNRELRGWVEPTWSTDPLPIARWTTSTDKPIKLHDYQNAALRKLLTNRGGLLAFDVGLGKTYTGIAALARARQDGWARRPVVVVPNSIIWKWHRDFARVLPDYRVVVIGAKRSMAARGDRKGRMVSTPDTPSERAEKWTAFQAGAYDVALVTYSALPRQQIDQAFVRRYVDRTVALRRSIVMSLEAADAAAAAAADGKKKAAAPTERKVADTAERIRAWVGEMLAPPKNWSYDPGIDWHQLGVDFLMVDEAQNFKNLFYSARDGGADRQAAKRAWALDFRCASVRERSGGAGVVLLSATPAKNSPVEFFTMLHLVNPLAWAQVAINNHESFITRFAKFGRKQVLDAGGQKLVERDVVVSFQNLPELVDVVYRWSTFKTAEEVGLKLPEVFVQQHQVKVTDPQQVELAKAYADLADVEDSIEKVAKFGDAKDKEQILKALQMKRQGIALRIYLIYLHPNLPGIGGDDKAIAAARPKDGPKLVECVKQVLATAERVCLPGERNGNYCLDCGHIIFVDNIAVHTWVQRLLVEAGIKADRIAILNAKEVPDLERRQQIVEAFNGVGVPSDDDYVEPTVDVVIANAVAYEGMDLQRRTCAIHHLDVPWEPATLQQRNGRGVRQGNTFAKVTLHYYFVQGSNEAWKIQRIERKRGWMASLVAGQARRTNTTMETEGEDPTQEQVEELALAHAPPELRERIRRAQKEQQAIAAEARRRSASEQANRELRQVAAMWSRARREADAERAVMLREQAEAGLRAVGRFRDLWTYDWQGQAARVRAHEAFIPKHGPPLFPGDRIVLNDVGFEVGRLGEYNRWDVKNREYVTEAGVWLRRVGGLNINHVANHVDLSAYALRFEDVAEDVATLGQTMPRLSFYDLVARWDESTFAKVSPATAQALWAQVAQYLPGVLSTQTGRIVPSGPGAVPVLVGGRAVALVEGMTVPTGAEIVPPTGVGWVAWVEAVERAPQADMPALRRAAKWWWWGERRLPKSMEAAVAA